ncbi:MAG: hypothetical protein LH461_06585 [Spirochaetaceae bacterium]|nr:hypothetical protein [Spirochaetaceae bacterium]
MTGDRGQGALWSLWAATVVLAVTVAVVSWAAALGARQRAEGAADLAALAGAGAQVRGENPCAAADLVARAHEARLVRCVPEPAAVIVVVEVRVPSATLRRLDVPPARARARAGVPP